MACLSDLPPDALLSLLNQVVAVSNTGQLLKLSLACKQYLELVATADWFWQQQSALLGWIRTGLQHPPRAQPPTAAHCSRSACHSNSSTSLHSNAGPAAPPAHHTPQHPTPPQAAAEQPAMAHPGTAAQQQAAAAATPPAAAAAGSRLWFQYYCLRMSCRWRLRLFVRKYIPFLNIQSRLAMQAGATLQQLEAAESLLGVKLPWELWELYRFRAGQAPGAGVCFADSCRCLGVHELSVTGLTLPTQPSLAPEGPTTQQQQLAAVQAQLPALSCSAGDGQFAHSRGGTWDPAAAVNSLHSSSQQLPRHCQSNTSSTMASAGQKAPMQQDSGLGTARAGSSSSSRGAGGLAATAGPDAVADAQGVVFLSNAMGSVQYAVAHNSAVYLKRGFTAHRVAGNLAGFMQHLLA